MTRDLIASGKPLLVSADARLEGESVKLLAQSIQSLEAAAAGTAAGLRIAVADDAALPGVRDAIAGERRGRGRMVLDLILDAETRAEIQVPGGFVVSGDLRSRLAAIPGVVEVVEV